MLHTRSRCSPNTVCSRLCRMTQLFAHAWPGFNNKTQRQEKIGSPPFPCSPDSGVQRPCALESKGAVPACEGNGCSLLIFEHGSFTLTSSMKKITSNYAVRHLPHLPCSCNRTELFQAPIQSQPAAADASRRHFSGFELMCFRYVGVLAILLDIQAE